MIAEDDAQGHPGWAQVGVFIGNFFDSLQYFYQYTKHSNDTIHTDMFGSPTGGSQITFEVDRIVNNANCADATNNCLRFLVAGSAQGDNPWTNFDPHSIWDGSNSEFYGETAYPGSDVAGISTNNVRFQNIAEKDGSDTVHLSWAGAHGGDCPYYNWENPNGAGNYTQFNVWTAPLNHNHSC